MLQQSKDTQKDTQKNIVNDIYTQIFSCTTREQKKELLIELSGAIKPLIEIGEFGSVNEGLIDIFKNNTHKNFKTFNEWKKQGFKVLKGSKCFFVWSSPLRGKKPTEDTKKGKEEETTKEYKFFGMAYLFSNAQVEKL